MISFWWSYRKTICVEYILVVGRPGNSSSGCCPADNCSDDFKDTECTANVSLSVCFPSCMHFTVLRCDCDSFMKVSYPCFSHMHSKVEETGWVRETGVKDNVNVQKKKKERKKKGKKKHWQTLTPWWNQAKISFSTTRSSTLPDQLTYGKHCETLSTMVLI